MSLFLENFDNCIDVCNLVTYNSVILIIFVGITEGGQLMIQFQHVNKTYRKKSRTIQALNDVNFTVNRHDIFGVIGYSGAGKSTLVRLVNHLESVSTGQVIVDGHDINQYSDKALRQVKKDIGMIFQHFNLLHSATVFKNVAMPLILSKVNKSDITQKVVEILDFVGLTDKKDHYPDELSGGQKQRVAIARALVTNPKILLCDEATSALDPATTASILELLKKVNREFGVTIMMITHEMSVIKQICNRVAVMEKGEVVEIGSVKDVFSHPSTLTAKNFVSTVIQTEPTPSLLEQWNTKQTEPYNDFKLFIDSTQMEQPIINDLIENYHAKVNIMFSSMSEIQGEVVCYMWLRLTAVQHFSKDDVITYFENQHIRYEEVR